MAGQVVDTVVVGTSAAARPPAVSGGAPARTARNLGEALAGARPGRWLWLIAADARPAADAQERLLEALDSLDDLPAPALLAGLPVGGGDHALPRGAELDTQLLLRAVSHGLVPIRHAALLSLLIDGAAVSAAPPPDTDRHGAFADRAWTGLLLREKPGYLVPASRVHVPAPAPPGLRTLPAIRRVRRDGVWTRGEAIRAAARALNPRAA